MSESTTKSFNLDEKISLYDRKGEVERTVTRRSYYEAHHRAIAAGLIGAFADLLRKDDMVPSGLIGSMIVDGADGKSYSRVLYFGGVHYVTVLKALADILNWVSHVERQRMTVDPKFSMGDLPQDETGLIRCERCANEDPDGTHAEEERINNGRRLLATVAALLEDGGLYQGVANGELIRDLRYFAKGISPEQGIS